MLQGYFMNKKLILPLMIICVMVNNRAAGLSSLEEITQVLRWLHTPRFSDEKTVKRIEEESKITAERTYHLLQKCSTRKDKDRDDLSCTWGMESLASYKKASKDSWREQEIKTRIEMIKHDALSGTLK